MINSHIELFDNFVIQDIYAPAPRVLGYSLAIDDAISDAEHYAQKCHRPIQISGRGHWSGGKGTTPVLTVLAA